MTQEEKRILIAEACGKYNQKWMVVNPNTHMLPDYFNDLNACHEMEKGLTSSQRFDYYKHLLKTCSNSETVNTIHATATQRAEAFGLTLGLWK